MFVPSDKVEEIAAKFKEYFKNKYENLQVKFETNINNPIAYLMKYILKTFDDLRNPNSKYTDLSLWYVYNSITRFYTSRTLISLDVYRCVNGRYDLLELTQMYKDRELVVYLNKETNKIHSIYDSIGSIYTKAQVIVQQVKRDSRFKLNYKKKYKEPIIRIDGVEYITFNNELVLFDPIKPVVQMSDMNLYQHYLDMNEDIEEYNLHHYGLVKNEMINRELLEGEILSINEYNVEFDL